MAPEHIAHASQLVYIVVPAACSAVRFAPAHRASFNSGCAVMSFSVISVFTSSAKHHRLLPPTMNRMAGRQRIVRAKTNSIGLRRSSGSLMQTRWWPWWKGPTGSKLGPLILRQSRTRRTQAEKCSQTSRKNVQAGTTVSGVNSPTGDGRISKNTALWRLMRRHSGTTIHCGESHVPNWVRLTKNWNGAGSPCSPGTSTVIAVLPNGAENAERTPRSPGMKPAKPDRLSSSTKLRQ
jgi:hypothetical protein